MRRLFTLMIAALLAGSMMSSCRDTSSLEDDIDQLKIRVTELEQLISQSNAQIGAVYALMNSSTLLVGVTPTEHGYTVELSNGESIAVTDGESIEYAVPVIGVNADGAWIISTDGGETFQVMTDGAGDPMLAFPQNGEPGDAGDAGTTPQLRVDKNGYWQISYDAGQSYAYIFGDDGKMINAFTSPANAYSGFFETVSYDSEQHLFSVKLLTGETLSLPVTSDFELTIEREGSSEELFLLNETRRFAVAQRGVREAAITAPTGWKAVLGEQTLDITAPAAAGESSGVISILITSEKGYLRSVQLPVRSSDYCKTWLDFYNQTADNVLLDYSYAGYKHGNEGIPAAESFGFTTFNVVDFGAVADDGRSDRAAFVAAVAAAKANGNGIIYFPEGEFDLHATGDSSESIIITMGNLILKGAGRDKTTIRMSAANQPTDPTVLYSSPVMINIKHNSTISELTSVTSDADKGTFSVDVASTSGIAVGDWVCLYLANNDEALIAEELGAFRSNLTGADLDINKNGVQVWDYHQVKSIEGSTLTFFEPLMHAVASRWNWTVQKYPHYENVGVEDLTFAGNAKADFVHHASWEDDGAFKPINLMRLTNSWMRRVGFHSVSEASSIVNCANVSVLDVKITGNRGHAAIRSQASSRVLIAKVIDRAGSTVAGAGQYHAVGVSKQSLGAVLWRNEWGTDANFESHATQPRATLIDCCTGGFLQFRQGGDAVQMPNHLADLTLWNMNATASDGLSNFQWWNFSSQWWKFLPPVIVGYHGAKAEFDPAQVIVDESHGQPALPQSLYEAQLQRRLGSVPAWLNELK